jgi:hypothetical protein
MRACLQRPAKEVLDEPLAEHGGERKGDEQDGNAILGNVTNTATYILRRLARDGAEDASPDTAHTTAGDETFSVKAPIDKTIQRCTILLTNINTIEHR